MSEAGKSALREARARIEDTRGATAYAALDPSEEPEDAELRRRLFRAGLALLDALKQGEGGR